MILKLNLESENLDNNENFSEESQNNAIGEGLDENFTRELLENEKIKKKNTDNLKQVIQEMENQSLNDGFF
jgi:hypothetical protein